MGIPLIQVDAFTDKAYAGNPAAVCVLSEALPDDWMQRVAQEMNLSETAFFYPEADGFCLRWFTPTVEVDLCGHATLAACHVLWTEGYLPAAKEARFYTRSGILTARRLGDWIELNFPANPSHVVNIPDGLEVTLGVKAIAVRENSLGYLVEVGSADQVQNLAPNFAALKDFPVHGVIVTSSGKDVPYDFVSRFFAPALGINEDPVTGSAHCCLGPYWQEQTGKADFLAYQASPRGGVVKVHNDGDRVRLSGQAVTIFRGELLHSNEN
jgi:predicted PhzF superfamily epimerase YddE/YHI9